MPVANSPHGPVEVKPDLPQFKKNCDCFRALPVCRQHGERFDNQRMLPFPTTHTCSVEKCENYASYLVVC